MFTGNFTVSLRLHTVIMMMKLEFKEKNIEMADGLKTHPYGLTEFAFIDINGYYIRVAEPSEEE